MASTLASQLQDLAVSGGSASHSRPSTRPSLLFHPSQAADIDVQTIFGFSQAGLDELVTIDSRFETFKKTLFSLESSRLDRELQPMEFNQRLDKSISSFLRLLSGYVMLTAAHQVLEYLIRRYKIQVYNVEDVVLCVLPYHETSFFVRVVQLLQIQNTRWQFLEAVKETGAAPPRTALVLRCTSDMGVLESICELGIAFSGTSFKSRITTSFVSVVLIETLTDVSSVSTELVNKILPFILKSFEKGIAEEYRVGALMVVGALINRATLAPSLVEALFHHIARAFQRASETDGVPVLQLHVMVMIQLLQTQEIHTFPSKSFKALVKVRDFLPILIEMVQKFKMQKFLALYVQAHVTHCFQHDHYKHAFLDAIESLPVETQVVPSVLMLLQASFGETDIGGNEIEVSNSRAVVKTVLQALEKRFPAEVDKAIALHFQNKKDAQGRKKKDDLVFLFLSDVFRGSLHAPMAETRMSVYLSLDHPQASIREKAIGQLSELASTQEPSEEAEMHAVLREAYLRRLDDDDYNVIHAVLTVDDLVKIIPAEPLFKALASIVSRCTNDLMTGERSKKDNAKTVSKLVIELLGSGFAVQRPEYVQQVASLYLEYLLQRPLTWRLNKYILKAAGSIPFPLFADLASVNGDTLSGVENGGVKSKKGRNIRQAAVNERIIRSLVANVKKDSSAFLALLDNAGLGGGSKLLLGTVLLQCLQQYSEALDTKFVNCSIRWLRDEWAIKGPGTDLRQDLQMIDYYSWNDTTCVPVDFYHRLEAEPHTARAELLLRILHSLVMCVPHRTSSKLEVGGQDSINELFMLFTNSVWPFKHHINLLMSRFPISETLPFLAKYFVSEDSAVPASVQVHSLNVLASQLQKISELKTKAVDRGTFMHLQSVLSPILVALASPLQDIRRSTVQCLEHLFTAWNNHVLKRKKDAKDLEEFLLNPTTFGRMLQALIEAQGTLISSGEYLGELFKDLYGPKEELLAEVEMRDASDLQSVLTFLVNQAFQLTYHGQRVILKLLQGIARGLELVRATHETRCKLVERRKLRHVQSCLDPASERLTQDEIQLLEILLQMYAPITPAEASQSAGVDGEALWSPFFDCFRVDGGSLDDPAVWQPCSAALNCLTPEFYNILAFPGQDFAFQALISLSTAKSETLRSTAHRVLKNIKIGASTVARHLDHLLEEGMKAGKTPKKTKRRKQLGEDNIIMIRDQWPANGKLLPATVTILELLFWKTDLEARQVLLAPLFKLLKNCLSGSWPESDSNEALTTKEATVLHVQQLVFMSLDNIVKSLAKQMADIKDSIKPADFDVETVVTAVNTATDATTRNYALALLTSLGKLIPDAVLRHLLDVLSVIGESTLTQDDSHSHQVVNHMLTALVPAWLAVEKDPTAVLQIFVRTLPRIPAHRRMAAITSLLSVTTEEEGLHIFVFLLLQKANSVARKERQLLEVQAENGHPEESKEVHDSLELVFAATLCRQYSPAVEFPALVRLLETAKVDGGLLEAECQMELPNKPPRPNRSQWSLQQLSTEFVAKRLHSTDLHHIGERFDDGSNNLQNSFVALVEQVLRQLQILDHVEGKSDARESYSLTPKVKNGIQGAAISLLDGLNIMMAPAEYLKGISSMMKHSDPSIRRKVLRMFTSKIKEMDRAPIKGGKSRKKAAHVVPDTDEHYSAEELELHVKLVSDITSSIQMRNEVDSVGNTLAAIEALDASAQRLANKIPDVFVSALPILVEQNLPLSKSAPRLKCLATIIGKVGPRALPALPATASEILDIAEEAFDTPGNKDEDDAYDHAKVVLKRSELIIAVLDALDALLENMGAFLTPYLQRIVRILVLQPQLLNSNTGIAKRAAAVRERLPTNTPVRLLLDPIIMTYQSALEKGGDSVVALFGVIGGMTVTADKSSVAAYHVRIFDFCVSALDLRGKGLYKLSSVAGVETAIMNAVVSLVMKLSETTFKPLFVKTLEWAESVTESEGGAVVNQSLDRNIVFYKLVNQLSSKLRSVFVPYLQYLIKGCVHHLTGGLSEIDTAKPKKKMKKSNTSDKAKGTLSPSEWHLRHLILSTLQQCFLYDTINFLDAPKFQLLLAPIVAQIMVGPPREVSTVKQGNEIDLPSVQEMDDVLVSCLGQMALTAGTDLLWKPLNHEVLMCTRVENTRARLLGLRVVKFLAAHLKEDYLVLLPETIPFLAELLEDTELTVVSQTQEVVKLLEDLSGEDLAQYF